MKRALAVFGPLAAALVLCAFRLPSVPAEAEASPRGGLSLELPMPSRTADVAPGTYDLQDGRSRFVLTATSWTRTVRGRTSAIRGWIRMGEDGPETIELTVDLSTLGPTQNASAAEAKQLETALPQMLGFTWLETFRFAGRASLATGVPQLPLQRVEWTGRADLGGPGHGLSMQMWHVALGNGRIHVQGTVEVDGDSWRLPHRYHLGLLPDPVSLTLGFDLEFHSRT